MVLAGRLRAGASRVGPYVVPLLVSATVGFFAIRGILAQAGRPALPLDDSFIHLQYARRIAEGHPFTFTAGAPPSSGATSFLWPLLLAPFHLAGVRELSLVWVVWALGTILHAAVAVEMGRLVRPLAGHGPAIAAQAACLGFGAFAWFAWSGMETIGFTWALLRAFRTASDLVAHGERPTAGEAVGVALAGGAAALFRPEGAVVALVACGVILVRGSSLVDHWPFRRLPTATWPRTAGWVGRLLALVPLAIAAVPPVLNLILVGHARSATATVKWLVGNPYYPPERLVAAIEGNARMLVTELVGGGPYTAIFLPEGSNWLFYLGAVCLVPLLVKRATRWRAALLLVFVIASIVPATYETMLWNRVRYIWPFAPAWFALVAILGRTVADVVSAVGARFARTEARGEGRDEPRDEPRTDTRAEAVALLVPALFAGALIGKLSWSLTDLATSARAIDHQQVTLGMWARDNLPADARIGVNDTGAIAYFSERPTFDVVGLTTEGEARYWVAGAGSRYEHYEKLPRTVLPTHFIVYREWMACPPVLGEELHSATVLEQSILGGATKTVYAARYDGLGRGELPRGVPDVVDAVDVADLESEAAHGYVVGPADRGDNLVWVDRSDPDTAVADGGRKARTVDHFVVEAKTAGAFRLVVRVAADEPIALDVAVDDVVLGQIDTGSWGFSEASTSLGHREAGPVRVSVRAPEGETFAALHYWLVVDDPGDA